MKYVSIVLIFFLAGAARADLSSQAGRAMPKSLQGVGIDQKLNAQLPLNAQFFDESGRGVKLGDYLGRRPAVLALVYYTCPVLCNQTLRGIVAGLRPLALKPGRDFDVIAISINPREAPAIAAAKRQIFVRQYAGNASVKGWHFLTGTEPNIRAVADAVGFHYRYDPASKMFLHAAGIMVLTPEGKAARYFYGVSFEPNDLKLGLIEASHNRIGTVVDQILLFCCRYDPVAGKYTNTVLRILSVAAAAFFVSLVAFLAYFWRDELRRFRRSGREVQHT